jgi:hypothetical protein
MNGLSRQTIGIAVALVVAASSATFAQTAAPQAGEAAKPAPTTTPPTSTVPRSMPINGQALTVKGEPRTGGALVTFSLYTDQNDSTPIWTEQQTVTLDPDGRYFAILGSASVEGLPADAFSAGTPRWLGVKVEADPEQPRMMLLSVPYALKAGDADTVGGKPVSDFVLSGKLNDEVKSTLKETVRTALKDEGVATKAAVSPNNPTTAGFLQKDTGGGLADSQLFDNGTNVGLGTAAPAATFDITKSTTGQTALFVRNPTAGASNYARLDIKTDAAGGRGLFDAYSSTFASSANSVAGGVSFTGIGPGGFSIAHQDASAPIRFWTGSGPSERMRINGTNGFIGINNTAPPSWLTVNGAIFANSNESNTIFNGSPGGQNAAIIGPGGYWAFRSNPSHTLHLDVFNSGSPINVLNVQQNGLIGVFGGDPNGLAAARFFVSGVGNPYRAITAQTGSNGEALHGDCLVSTNLCYGVEGSGSGTNYGGVFYGGHGVYVSAGTGSGNHGVETYAQSSNGYALYANGLGYRGAYINSSSSGGFFSMFVDTDDPANLASKIELMVNAGAHLAGQLIVDGAKTGFVVDIMQNVGNEPLEPGDVVVIAGNSAPVTGSIPVVTVRKATAAYDTGIVGVVDEKWYVPDAATKAAYQAQEKAIRQARAAHAEAFKASGGKAEPIAMPAATIPDMVGNVHALPNEPSIETDAYCSVVTLGAYKLIKVDASFGAIHAGDLLTTSQNAGYAMKVTDKVAAIGAVVGKALADLEQGTGLIPVMVVQR